MADEQVDLLESFRVFIKAAEEGAAIPPVAEHDLKRLHELCVQRAKRYCGKDGVVTIDSMARACSPDANLPAVWLRHAQLRSLYRQGLLAEWQHGTALDDAVFRLAATIPIKVFMWTKRPSFDTFAPGLRSLNSLAGRHNCWKIAIAIIDRGCERKGPGFDN
jgi:hypothetical protein